MRVYPFPRSRLRLLGRDVGLVLWPSFLAACGASLLFFAAVDPLLLRDAGPRIFAGIERESGYALGFAFFWATGAMASALSVYLIRTSRSTGNGTDRLS
jgi:hypothetical protein